MKNYIELKNFYLFSISYVFVDTIERLYTRLLPENGIKIKRFEEYSKTGTGISLVICRIRKKDKEKFESIIGEIRNRALLLGHNSYDEVCEMLMDIGGNSNVRK